MLAPCLFVQILRHPLPIDMISSAVMTIRALLEGSRSKAARNVPPSGTDRKSGEAVRATAGTSLTAEPYRMVFESLPMHQQGSTGSVSRCSAEARANGSVVIIRCTDGWNLILRRSSVRQFRLDLIHPFVALPQEIVEPVRLCLREDAPASKLPNSVAQKEVILLQDIGADPRLLVWSRAYSKNSRFRFFVPQIHGQSPALVLRIKNSVQDPGGGEVHELDLAGNVGTIKAPRPLNP